VVLGQQAKAENLLYIAQDKTVSDARTVMKAQAAQMDVFVTATGKATDPILGWLTNALLAETSQT
jgi:hypothetical protein